MPKVSDRQKQLKTVRDKLQLNIVLHSSTDEASTSGSHSDQLTNSESDKDLNSCDDSDGNSDMFEVEGSPGDLFELYAVMDSTRYFRMKGVSVKSKEFATQYFDKLPASIFRQMTRMDKESFFNLVAMIEDHPVFQNEAQVDQTAVELQLAVTLDRLGHNGNGACLNHMLPTWGVSHGSICKFTSRCFDALDGALAPYLKWPKMGERRLIAEEFGKKGFPGCVGLIDGTLIPLGQRPPESGECYYDRKCRYSMNAQVVCDHRRKITFLYTGMPGPVSDITCFKRSSVYREQNAGRVFSAGEYLLGDSGYEAMDHMVCAYKKAECSRDREDFNMCVAKCRVVNEHCIGVLKTRWHSLREMRTQLKSKAEKVWLVRWIVVCARLHNYVLTCNDDWTSEDSAIMVEDSSDEDEIIQENPQPQSMHGSGRHQSQELQNAVMQYALQFNRQLGGCLSI